jgi:hypothetical protein
MRAPSSQQSPGHVADDADWPQDMDEELPDGPDVPDDAPGKSAPFPGFWSFETFGAYAPAQIRACLHALSLRLPSHKTIHCVFVVSVFPPPQPWGFPSSDGGDVD